MPALELARGYYTDLVRPLLAERFPGLPHTAALIGYGSEILGYDTARSTDHNWGPRLQLFVPGDAPGISAALDELLPDTWAGYPTRFTVTLETDQVARHRIEVARLGDWLTGWLGFDPRAGVTTTDWLATPTQRLLEVTAGAVYHDPVGELTAARDSLAWYPDDLWRFVLACQWQRIGQEEAFPGRCAEVGDDIGSRVVAARLARDIMRLCLLMSRRYPPYSKWLGTAFAQLPGIGDLPQLLAGAVSAVSWADREDHLVAAYRAIAVRHNELGLTDSLSAQTRGYFDRPIRVLGCGRFVRALLSTISDPEIGALPLTGAVDQFLDSVEVLGDNDKTRAIVEVVR
jgi:hypothetical protein